MSVTPSSRWGGTSRSYGRRAARHPRDCRTSAVRHAVFRPPAARAARRLARWTRSSSGGRRSASGSRRCSSARAAAPARSCCVSGEAGVGKTRLTARAGARAGRARPARRRRAGPHGALRPARRGAARAPARAPRRARRRAARCAATSRCCCPSSASRPAAADRATLFEALRCALARVAPTPPRCVVLDDLQWSDEATLEVLSALAEPLARAAAARGRRLPLRRPAARPRRAPPAQRAAPRGPARRARAARRSSSPRRAELLARALGARARAVARARDPRPHRGHAVLRRGARRRAARQRRAAARAARASSSAGDGEVPLPDTVRDAVLISASRALGAGARGGRGRGRGGRVVRPRRSSASLSSDDGRHRAARARPGARAGRRHRARSGTRSRARRSTPTSRGCAGARCTARSPRRSRRARRAQPRGRPALARRARRRARARGAAARGRRVRGGARLPRRRRRRPPGARAVARGRRRGAPRRDALERYARCCQLAGELARGRARVARAGRRARRHRRAWSPTRSAGSPRCSSSRATASAAFARAARRRRGVRGRPAQPAEAAVERLAIANQRRLAARHGEAIELAQAARARRRRAPAASTCGSARSGVEGMARAKHGDYEAGLETVRDGLALALEHDLTAVAAELYQRLSVTLYESADFRRAEEALDTALELCRREPGRRHDRRLRDAAWPTCCASAASGRARREMCRELIADGTRGLRRRGPARRDPRLRGPLRLGAAAAHLLARRRDARRATTT